MTKKKNFSANYLTSSESIIFNMFSGLAHVRCDTGGKEDMRMYGAAWVCHTEEVGNANGSIKEART